MARKFIVITQADDGCPNVEIIDEPTLLKRITPRPGETDAYYGGDYGVIFVDSMDELLAPSHSKFPAPCKLLIYEVGEPVRPIKAETVIKYRLP